MSGPARSPFPRIAAAEAGLLLGSWRLQALATTRDGTVERPLGDRPSGQISYGPDGRMAVHLARGGAITGTPMPEYAAYSGDYTIDMTERTVVHHVDGASVPGIVGTDLPRRFRLDDDRLWLSADTAQGETVLEWCRADTDDAVPAGFVPLVAPGIFPRRAGRFWVADRDGPVPVVGTRIGAEQSNSEGFAHGGFLLAYADFAATIMVRGITLNLSADFLRPARIGDWVEARIVTRKRSADLIFADAIATCNGRDALRISGLFKPFERQT